MNYFSVRSSADMHTLASYLIDDFVRFQAQLSPFEEYWVVIPSASVQSWLVSQITQKLGVCAGINFLQPAQALWHFQRQLNADLPEISPFSKACMALRLYAMFTEFLNDEAAGKSIDDDFSPLLHYLHQQPSDNARISLASRIADVFDAYLMYRPDWIASWEGENSCLSERDRDLLKLHRWQPKLWQRIVAGAGSAVHRAELANMLNQHIANNKSLYYPRRIVVFGVSTLEPQVLKQLALLSGTIEITLYWQNPCADFWVDTLPPASKGALVQQLDGENAWLAGNPLLAAWGQYARGFYAQLVDADLLDFDADAGWGRLQVESTQALHCVQQAINSNTSQVAGKMTNDGSISIAAHWSRKREVDGLHDFLLGQFLRAEAMGKPLLPHEVVVMLPDVDAYAPFIEAVFDAQPNQRLIPYQLCGASVTQQNVLGAIHGLLTLPKGRYPVSELLDILHLPDVKRTFMISEEDDYKLQAWIHESGIHWGLDEHTWVQQGLPPCRDNTLAGGVDRLLMGLALDDEVFAVLENNHVLEAQYGIAGVSALNAQLVGQLAAFVDALTQWRDFCAHEHLIPEWVNVAMQQVEAVFTVDRDHLAELAEFKQAVTGLIEQGSSAGITKPVNVDVFLKMLEPMLDAGKNKGHFQWGKVTIGSFSATRGIPYRVTAILGMNDADFPATPENDDIDLLPLSYRLGDRSPTAADRYTFLQALMSSEEAFYCSYVSRDICNGAVYNPSLLIVELLEFINNNDVRNSERIVQHPLQPFSDVYFTENFAGLITYASQWQRFQQASRTLQPDTVVLPWTMPATLYVEDLRRFMENPAEAYFKTVFNTTFNSPNDMIEDDEPFEVNKLLEWEIKQALIWQGEDELAGNDHLFLKWQARGILPKGYAETGTEKLMGSVEKIRSRLLPLLNGTQKTNQVIDIGLSIGTRLMGEIELYYSPEQNRYFSLSAVHKSGKEVKAKYRLRLMLNHMLMRQLVMAGDIPNHTAIIVCEDNAYEFVESADHHVNVLEDWIALYQQAMSKPVALNATMIDELRKILEGKDSSLLSPSAIRSAFDEVFENISDFDNSIALQRLIDDPLTDYDLLPYLQAFAIEPIEPKGNDTWKPLYE